MSENVSISIGGSRWTSWSSASVRMSLDSVSEASFTAPFEAERQEFREVFRPFSYRDVIIDIDGDPIFSGTMVGVEPHSTSDESTVDASCYGRPGVMGDCPMPAASWPLEFNGLTLKQIADRCCEPFGVVARFDLDESAQAENDAYRSYLARVRKQRGVQADLARVEAVPEIIRRQEAYDRYQIGRPEERELQRAMVASAKAEGETREVRKLQELQKARDGYASFSLAEPSVVAAYDAQIAASRAKILNVPGPPLSLDTPFKRVAIKPEENPFAFLAGLAKQRNFVIADTRNGELLFWRSIATGAPVARFVEGQPPVTSITATFGPQAYFSEVTGVAKTKSGRPGGRFTAANPFARGITRPSVFSPEDTEKADLERATNARLGRMLGNAVSFEVTVPTIRDASGNIWRPNSTVTLLAPSVMVYRETELLIRDVRLDVGASSESAALTLVLPGSFSGELPEAMPWD